MAEKEYADGMKAMLDLVNSVYSLLDSESPESFQDWLDRVAPTKIPSPEEKVEHPEV